MSATTAPGSLPRYIATRVLLVIPMMWVLLTIVFLLLRVAPGDPVSAAVGGKLDQEALEARREAAGFDRPLIVQYFDYFGQLLRFDFGQTYRDKVPILEIIRDNGGATLTLTVGAFLFALLIGLPLGRLAGRHRDTALDAGIRIFGVITYAAPIFWVGTMMVAVIVNVLPGWPTNDIAGVETKYYMGQVTTTHILLVDTIIAGDNISLVDVLKHHLFPCITLGLMLSGVIIRLVRVNVIQALKGDYVEAARARGIPEGQVVRKHAFRNALVPVVTVIGLQVALTMSGAVLTETTFNWPGLGTQLVTLVRERDYVAVQGLVAFFAIIVVIVSLVVDIVNAMIDPRVRY